MLKRFFLVQRVITQKLQTYSLPQSHFLLLPCFCTSNRHLNQSSFVSKKYHFSSTTSKGLSSHQSEGVSVYNGQKYTQIIQNNLKILQAAIEDLNIQDNNDTTTSSRQGTDESAEIKLELTTSEKRVLEAYQKVIFQQNEDLDDLLKNIQDTYLALGELFESQNKLENGIESYQQALNAFEHTDSSLQSKVDMQKRIAKLLYKQGQIEEALEAYQKVLSVQLQHKRDDIIDKKSLANTYYEISNIQLELNNSDEAIKTNESALNLALESFDEGDLDTALYHISLGEKLSLQGDAELAIEQINKGLYIQLLALGMSHPTVGKTYMDLGMIHQAKGLTFEALECYMKSLEIFENCQDGVYDEDIVDLYEFIGDVYCEEERYREARDFYKEAIELKIQHNDQEEKKNIGLLYQKLGDCNAEVGSFRAAKEAYLEAVTAYKEVYEANSLEFFEAVQQLGDYAFKEGSLEEALKFYTEALALCNLQPEERIFETVELYKCIAGVAFQKGDFEMSVRYDKQTLNFYLQEKLIARTEEIYERLGEANKKAGRVQEAQKVYKEGLIEHLEYFGTEHPGVEKFYNELKELYTKGENVENIDELDKLLAKYK